MNWSRMPGSGAGSAVKFRYSRELIAMRKLRYQPGTRLRLVGFAPDSRFDDHEHLPAGSCGTATFVDDLGTIHVQWDNGSTLGITLSDQFELAPPRLP